MLCKAIWNGSYERLILVRGVSSEIAKDSLREYPELLQRYMFSVRAPCADLHGFGRNIKVTFGGESGD